MRARGARSGTKHRAEREASAPTGSERGQIQQGQPSEPPFFGVEKPVGLLVSDLASLYQRAFLLGLNAEVPEADLSGADHAVLRCVAQGRVTSTTIARELGLSKQAIGKTVESLEGRGYVQRSRGDGDQRERVVLLTEEGARMTRRALSVARALEARTEGVLGAEELARLRATLARLLAAEAQIVEG